MTSGNCLSQHFHIGKFDAAANGNPTRQASDLGAGRFEVLADSQGRGITFSVRICGQNDFFDLPFTHSLKEGRHRRGINTLAFVRDDLAAKDMTVLLAVNTKFKAGPDPNPLVMQVVEAQKQVAETLPRCDYVDTSAASVANAAHFDAPGTLDVGRRFAEGLLAAEATQTGAIP